MKLWILGGCGTAVFLLAIAPAAAQGFTPEQQAQWDKIHVSCHNYVFDKIEEEQQKGYFNQRLTDLDPATFKIELQKHIETEMVACLNEDVGKDPLFGAGYRIRVAVKEEKPS
ncbi:MAG: hypothetical protein AAB582_03085 [Patescibacteria group bacterium]